MSKAFKIGICAGVPLGVALYFASVWLLPIMGKWTWIYT